MTDTLDTTEQKSIVPSYIRDLEAFSTPINTIINDYGQDNQLEMTSGGHLEEFFAWGSSYQILYTSRRIRCRWDAVRQKMFRFEDVEGTPIANPLSISMYGDGVTLPDDTGIRRPRQTDSVDVGVSTGPFHLDATSVCGGGSSDVIAKVSEVSSSRPGIPTIIDGISTRITPLSMTTGNRYDAEVNEFYSKPEWQILYDSGRIRTKLNPETRRIEKYEDVEGTPMGAVPKEIWTFGENASPFSWGVSY